MITNIVCWISGELRSLENLLCVASRPSRRVKYPDSPLSELSSMEARRSATQTVPILFESKFKLVFEALRLLPIPSLFFLSLGGLEREIIRGKMVGLEFHFLGENMCLMFPR